MSTESPAYAQPKKKKHTLRNVLLILLGLTLLGIAGCFALVGSAVNEVDKEAKRERVVVYEVTGTARQVDVSYTTDGSTSTAQENGVKLPWRKEVKVSGLVPVYQVMGQAMSKGTVACKITVDGEVVKENESRGMGALATCDHTD